MARCPHCNMVLSGSEAKASHCTICKGALSSSSALGISSSGGDDERSATAAASVGHSAATAQAVSTSTASSASARRSELPRFSTGALVLLLLAVWCLVMLVWFAGGDASRIPPRLLGAILLAAPVGLAAFGARD